MNILFLNPPFIGRFSRASRSPAIAKGGTLYYPVWLASATGTAEQKGHNSKLVDAPADGLDMADVLQIVKEFKPEIVVADTSTGSLYSDIECVEQIKAQQPDIFTVLVGTHPSALPEETLKNTKCIDAVAMREYDYTIPDLADALQKQRPLTEVKGIAFKTSEGTTLNGEREKITDLDALPFPSIAYKKHLQFKNYFFAAANYPIIQIMTGRGCPFKCNWCVYPQVFHSHRYRTRSAENVADEFEYIVANFPGVKEIGIEDDCFTADRGRVKKICELLIQRNVQIKWYCNVRGDVPYDLLKLMKMAGCRMITVGFESNDQEVLNAMKKGMKVEKYYQFANDSRKAGLLVHGCIMVGNPGDTKERLEKYYQFAKEINCDSMQFYPVYLYPGTEAYDIALEKGYIKTTDFKQWLTEDGLHNCILNTPELSASEMVNLCNVYLKKYHLRPAYIWMKMKQALVHPSEGYRSLKSAKIFFSKIFTGQMSEQHT